MSGPSKDRVRSVACDQPDPGAHFDQGLQPLCCGIQQIPVGENLCGLGQKNDRRPAKMKVSLVLAPSHRSALVSLNNTADGQCTHLDLKHASAVRVRQQANHALVLKARCAGRQCDRMYRVEHSPDTCRPGRHAIGREMKAVIIAGRQANHETGARFEAIQAPNEFVHVDRAALYSDSGVRHLGECQHSTLGRCYQVEGVSIDWPRPGFELPCEKCIQRTVGLNGALGFPCVDFVATNEGTDLAPAYRRSFQQAAETAEPLSLDACVQKRRSPPGLVKKPELALAVHPLSSKLGGFAMNIGDLVARRSHRLLSRPSGKRDRTTDDNVQYTIASINPASPELHDFARLPHVRSLNSLAPPAADVILQLGADSLFYRHGQTRLFGCYRNEQLVGRVVASVDHELPDQDVGHFGYFEVCPDKACAGMLMQACEDWLREKGKKRIEGPINLNILAGYRVQTAGFDTQAFPGEPRNPEYYPALLDSLGYCETAHWNSWDISPWALLALRVFDRLQRSKRRATRARGYRVEALRTDRLEEETRKIHRLVHEIFADNYGFSAIDLAEHLQLQGAAMDGSARVSGAFLYHSTNPDPVGFCYGFYMGQTAIFHTFGVTGAHRGSGGADLLFHQGLQDIDGEGVSRAIGALAKEGKTKYERIGSPGRAYAIYGRDL